MSTANRHWILAHRPVGNAYAEAFALETETLPALGEGQILVANKVLSMDSGTRMYMTDREDSYQPGTPLGAKLIGTVLGVVVDSRHPEYKAGDRVRCYGQWADFSVVEPDTTYCTRLDDAHSDLKEYVGIYGANGWTAWVGVVETGAVKAGETFVVSAAAGCTGLMAGQIAKAHGCRVIGIAGGAAKCDLLTEEYGFDGAIDYKSANVETELARLCPDGIDVYFDNVGGEILDAALANMALFGRVAVCGLITNYIAQGPVPGPYRFDQVLMKRLRIEGFFSPDFYAREPEFNPQLARLAAAGQLRLPFEVSTGLEETPAAFTKLFTGANVGKVVVEL
ncbi:NADP-dependent oxidoreductase [Novosphingobium sp.]|uniref:NADP-dependent oxidoreductase n=1 Tax=Novosphingobium sp. TaxID=1874826 RepID=UPI00260C31E1|nr:NADP-dependent oxidoreductase [Novosphingobium sp.]